MEKLLAIGIGNCLRGDDGIGAQVIERLQQLPGTPACMQLKIVHQLDVSHAAVIKDYTAVIFVDADQVHSNQPVRVQEMFPDGRVSAFTSHIGSIANLLAVTEAVYGKTPRTFLIAVRGVNFAIEDEVSPEAMANIQIAANELLKLAQQLFPSSGFVSGAGTA